MTSYTFYYTIGGRIAKKGGEKIVIVKNTTPLELSQVLRVVNKKYDGNVEFKRLPEWVGRSVRFTLKVKNSKGKGARLGFTGKHIASACWHIHGDFFEALLSVNPQAVIRAGSRVIDVRGGNWDDWNIGSIVNPLYYSNACEC